MEADTHTHCLIHVSAYIFCWWLIEWSQMDQKLSTKQETPKLRSNCNLVKTFMINRQSSLLELMRFCPGALSHVCIISGSQMLSWSLIVEGHGSRVCFPSGTWAVLGGSLLPLWLMKDCAGLPSLLLQLILCSHPHSHAGISPEDRQTHTHPPTHPPTLFRIPINHGVLCSSW